MEAEISSRSCRQFSLFEIQLATHNFDDALVVGEGGFGKVYKATITVENGATLIVAIKRLDSSSNQGEPEFWAEIKMLTKLRHCNLVSLIGYCNDNSEMILVYEFMPNGTLDDHLHNHKTSLNWVQRLKISIGAARGLHYLHTVTDTQNGVIHRDVKTSNILLDQDYAAKISDFGLSKFGVSGTKTIVRGTFGYLDPEYFLIGRLTWKSDVFAFGVVLFELLCGREALDTSLDEDERSLVKWVHESIENGKLNDIIDSKIKSQIFPKCLKVFVKIADRCLSRESNKRPTMAEVLVDLELSLTLQNKFKNRLKPAAAGKMSIVRMIKWPFISHEVKVNSGQSERKPLMINEDTIEHSSSSREDPLNHVPAESIKLPAFREYTLDELLNATDGFSEDNIVSEDGLKARNIVYKGKLEDDDSLIAIKRFHISDWLDTREFLDEARAVGRLRSQRLANLLGYCYEGDERLLVAEFMPHETLPKHLFHWEYLPLSGAIRLRVALYLAQALDYCSSKGRYLYHDLNVFKILFDQECNPRLSSFGLMKNRQDELDYEEDLIFNTSEYVKTGLRMREVAVIYNFGVILLELLRGKRINLRDALDLIAKKNFNMLMDPYIEGFFPDDDANQIIKIASQCLQDDPQKRPYAKWVVNALIPLQKKTDIPSHVLMGIRKAPTPATQILNLSPLGNACSQMDLTAIHEILEKIGYSGDDASLQLQTDDQLQDALNQKELGDNAFGAKDFATAIECYTSFIESGPMVSLTMYLRRCLSYLMINKAQEALGDAMQAQVINPEWSTALYLQAVALFSLGMNDDAHEMLKDAASLDSETKEKSKQTMTYIRKR